VFIAETISRLGAWSSSTGVGMPIHDAAKPLTLAGLTTLAGCDAYPPAAEVARCAAARFGTAHGTFTSGTQNGSQVVITYQKRDSPDRAIVIYDRRHGPVSTHREISFGNHA
jgi:hypothetical protein